MIGYRCKVILKNKLGLKSLIRYLFFPMFLKQRRINLLGDISAMCFRCDEKTSNYIENLKETGLNSPLLGVRREAVFVPFIKYCRNETSYWGLCIFNRDNFEVSNLGTAIMIKISGTQKKYVIIFHAETDEVLVSQGIDIAHEASVLRFTNETLDTIWAYHKTRGLIKLG